MNLTIRTVRAGSLEYLEAVVDAAETLEGSDPAMALASPGVAPTWLDSSWVDTPTTTGTVRTDAPVVLAAGTYTVLVRVQDTPEAPIREAYILVVTE